MLPTARHARFVTKTPSISKKITFGLMIGSFHVRDVCVFFNEYSASYDQPCAILSKIAHIEFCAVMLVRRRAHDCDSF